MSPPRVRNTELPRGVWFGLLAPAATPPAIVEKLNRDIVRALQSPELKEKLAQQGADVTTSTPDEFHAHIQDETPRWAEVIKNSGIKAE